MENYQHNRNQEIDMVKVSDRLKGYLSRVNDSFFDGILFLKRNIIVLVVLFIAGGALGYYFDKGKKTYEQKLIVIPNFKSVDYLYEAAELLTSKSQTRDEKFLQGIGIKDPDVFIEMEVEPIVEVYDFIESEKNHERNLQVFRIMAENASVEETLKDMATARNYSQHLVTITTRGKVSADEVVNPILAYLNADKYYGEIKQQWQKNLDIEIRANDSIITQIDAIINTFNKDARAAGENLVYYNTNTQFNELIKTKAELVEEQGRNMIKKVNYESVIKPSSVMLNVKKKSFVSGRMKFIVPLVFIMLFVFISSFIGYYKSQINKRKSIAGNE
jgi:hypothetical protein